MGKLLTPIHPHVHSMASKSFSARVWVAKVVLFLPSGPSAWSPVTKGLGGQCLSGMSVCTRDVDTDVCASTAVGFSEARISGLVSSRLNGETGRGKAGCRRSSSYGQYSER